MSKHTCILCGRRLPESEIYAFRHRNDDGFRPPFYITEHRGVIKPPYPRSRNIFFVCLDCLRLFSAGKDRCRGDSVLRGSVYSFVKDELGLSMPPAARKIAVLMRPSAKRRAAVVRLPAGSIHRENGKILPFSVMHSDSPESYAPLYSVYIVLTGKGVMHADFAGKRSDAALAESAVWKRRGKRSKDKQYCRNIRNMADNLIKMLPVFHLSDEGKIYDSQRYVRRGF